MQRKQFYYSFGQLFSTFVTNNDTLRRDEFLTKESTLIATHRPSVDALVTRITRNICAIFDRQIYHVPITCIYPKNKILFIIYTVFQQRA